MSGEAQINSKAFPSRGRCRVATDEVSLSIFKEGITAFFFLPLAFQREIGYNIYITTYITIRWENHMIKILHCADLHLDSPMTVLDTAKSEVRRNELRAAFTSLTLLARNNNVDLLLIAGDLFDDEFVSKDTMAIILREFAAMSDCRIVIAPGNHDPFTGNGYYRRADFPDNVYIFDTPELSCFDFPEINTAVYGYAFTGRHMERCPIDGKTVADPSRINLLVAHGDLDAPSSDYCPISSDALARCGFDYAALGHRHTYEGTQKVGECYVAYSGCIEGRGFDECGEKGAIMAVADKAGELRFASKFVKLCKREYVTDDLDISGAASNADALEKISEYIESRHYGDEIALRLRLTGNVKGDFKLSVRFLADQFPKIFIFEIEDATRPVLDAQKLRNDPTLKGAFYRSLEPLLTSEDEDERERASLALRYGLAALAGNDFSDM